jgi:hypothetical protein
MSSGTACPEPEPEPSTSADATEHTTAADRISLRSLLDGDAAAAEAVRQAMRSQSFVILGNDVDHAAATSGAEGAALQFFLRMVADDESETSTKAALLQGVKDSGLRELGFATTTAKLTFNYKHGPGFPPNLWPPPPPGAGAAEADDTQSLRRALSGCFDFLERVCAASYAALQFGGAVPACTAFLSSHGALGVPASGLSSSVLQCFYYANSAALDENPNCGEHVDQGFLSIEPATKVPSRGC